MDFNDTLNVMPPNFQCSFLFHGEVQPWWTAPAVSKSDCEQVGDSLLHEMDWIGFAKREAEAHAFFDRELGLNLVQGGAQGTNTSWSRLTEQELNHSIDRHMLDWQLIFGANAGSCFSQGEWVASNASIPYKNKDSWQNSCSLHSHRRWYGWDWQAAHQDKCEMTAKRMDVFVKSPCEVLVGKTILILGDSISFNFAVSMLRLLGHGDIPESSQAHNNYVYHACGNTTSVVYIRNDCAGENCRCGDFCSKFWDRLWHFDFVIMNRGAHAKGNTNLQSFREDMLTFSQKYTEQSRGLTHTPTLFWRTSPPGHWSCDNVKGRHYLPIPPEKWPDRATGERLSKSRFKWHLFKDFNTIALAVLESTLDVRKVRFVHASAYAGLRADRHQGGGDCLHYCMPGPTDEWARLFFYQAGLEVKASR